VAIMVVVPYIQIPENISVAAIHDGQVGIVPFAKMTAIVQQSQFVSVKWTIDPSACVHQTNQVEDVLFILFVKIIHAKMVVNVYQKMIGYR
jgi:hypothetical protein